MILFYLARLECNRCKKEKNTRKKYFDEITKEYVETRKELTLNRNNNYSLNNNSSKFSPEIIKKKIEYQIKNASSAKTLTMSNLNKEILTDDIRKNNTQSVSNMNTPKLLNSFNPAFQIQNMNDKNTS